MRQISEFLHATSLANPEAWPTYALAECVPQLRTCVWLGVHWPHACSRIQPCFSLDHASVRSAQVSATPKCCWVHCNQLCVMHACWVGWGFPSSNQVESPGQHSCAWVIWAHKSQLNFCLHQNTVGFQHWSRLHDLTHLGYNSNIKLLRYSNIIHEYIYLLSLKYEYNYLFCYLLIIRLAVIYYLSTFWIIQCRSTDFYVNTKFIDFKCNLLSN